MEGSGRGLILASARHLHEETMEKHEKPPNCGSSGRCVILVLYLLNIRKNEERYPLAAGFAHPLEESLES